MRQLCFRKTAKSLFIYCAARATGSPHKQCVCLCSKYKEMYGRILKSLNIVNLYLGTSKLKLKIDVKVPQFLCIVVSVALNGKFERFGGFCVFIATVNAKHLMISIETITNKQTEKTQEKCLFAKISRLSITC